MGGGGEDAQHSSYGTGLCKGITIVLLHISRTSCPALIYIIKLCDLDLGLVHESTHILYYFVTELELAELDLEQSVD